MTFLQPWAVWFLAGAPVIILLYFLRHRRREVEVSTHLFWQRALQESSRRALFRRLRHVLSLLLHLVIYGLIVAALARPTFERAVASGASTVIVLDARARMQALEADGKARFSRAVEIARQRVQRVGEQRQTALVTLDANAAVAVPFSSAEKPFTEALEKLSATDTGGDMQQALNLASSLLASRSGVKELVIITDRDVPAPALQGVAVSVEAVGSRRDNVAITRFAARALPASPDTNEVLLEVQNFGDSPVRAEVELSFDGRALDVVPISLKPGERRQEVIASVPRASRSGRGWLVARLAGNDALALDNTAYAVLPPLRPARVLLVSAGNRFLEKFLSVDNTLKYQILDPAAWQASLAAKFEVVIFDGIIPPGFDLSKGEGNYFFLRNGPFPSTEMQQPVVTEVDALHPATRSVSLQNVSILKANVMGLPPSRDGWVFGAPLRSFDNALMVAGERQGRRVAVLGFDVLESDLPLRIAFPLLMSNTLHWLAGERMESVESALTSEVVNVAEGGQISVEPVADPRNANELMAPAGGFQPMRAGIYKVQSAGETRWLAANFFAAEESDLRGSAGSDVGSGTGVSLAGSMQWPLWQWLALAALGLFTMEWWWFHRRKTE